MSQFDQSGQHIEGNQFNAGRDQHNTFNQYSGFPAPSFPPVLPQSIRNIAPERITSAWAYQEREDVYSVTFCPGTQWLATAQQYRILNLWDVTRGERARTLTLSSRLESIAFSPNGRVLASFGGDEMSTGEDDDTIKIWSVATGALVRTLKHPRILLQVVFSPDGRWLASASFGEQYYIWDLARWTLQQRVGEYLDIRILYGNETPLLRTPLAFSPDGQWLAGLDKYGSQLTIWQAGDGRVVKTFEGLAYVGIDDLAFSSDGQWLACISNNGIHCCAHLWSVETGKIVWTFDRQTIYGYAGPLKFNPNGQPYDPQAISSLAFSPDGQWLAISGAGTLRLWEIATRKVRQTFDVRADHLAFSPDGQWLAIVKGKAITLWKMQ